MEEQKYDIILKFAEEQITVNSPFKVDIITLLKDLEAILPDKVWKLYKAQAMFYYNLKSRSNYKEAIIYFKRMKKINPKETKTLLKELYGAKPIRRAFREEIKKSRLL